MHTYCLLLISAWWCSSCEHIMARDRAWLMSLANRALCRLLLLRSRQSSGIMFCPRLALCLRATLFCVQRSHAWILPCSLQLLLNSMPEEHYLNLTSMPSSLRCRDCKDHSCAKLSQSYVLVQARAELHSQHRQQQPPCRRYDNLHQTCRFMS